MKKLYAWLCLRWRMVAQPKLLSGASKLKGVRKLLLDAVLAVSIVLLIASHFKDMLPNDLQVYLIKMGQINIPLIYGWIVGRLFLGKVDWENEKKFTPQNVGRLFLWGVIIIAFALGG